jgi:hypothetical protein
MVLFIDTHGAPVIHKEEREKVSAELRKRQEMLRHNLTVEQDDIHANVQQLQASLDRAFGVDKVSPTKMPRRYVRMTPALLQSEPVYKEWRTAGHSCALILAGTTPPEALMNRSTHSWLSLGALGTTESLKADQQVVAHYWCHPEDHSEEVVLKVRVFQLVYQILCQRVESLGKITGDFEVLFAKANMSGAGPAAVLEPLNAVLQAQEKTTTVWIIVDRFDQCVSSRARLDALQQFLGALNHTPCTTKMLITIDTMFWPMEDWRYDKKSILEMQEESNGLILSKLDWDQPRDPSKW